MAGFDLKKAQFEQREVSDDELWSVFSNMFSSRSRNNTSYKFGFFKSILDNLYNVDENLKLSFDLLFDKFTEIYWNLILKYGIRQKIATIDNRETYLEQVLHEAFLMNHIVEGLPFESLSDNITIKLCHDVKIKCKKYVIGALYEDSKRLFYSFSKKEEWIQLNPQVYIFLSKHKQVIEKLNYYEWAKFLEKVNNNETTINLLNKLDCSALRNDLSIYRHILYRELENKTCFYCGKPLKAEQHIEVDHFIPWSFIKDDNLWNLVLSCPECNRKKSDKLPHMIYLNNLVERNDMILLKNSYQKKMENYKEEKFRKIYYWAKCNGYERIWTTQK